MHGDRGTRHGFMPISDAISCDVTASGLLRARFKEDFKGIMLA